MLFKQIRLTGWQQFEEIDIDVHPELTIITGANGSGKTTLLRFLARHFGWSFSQLRTPQITLPISHSDTPDISVWSLVWLAD